MPATRTPYLGALMLLGTQCLFLAAFPRKKVPCHIELAATTGAHPFSYWLATEMLEAEKGGSWLAEKTSISPASITRYLSGHRLPPRNTVIALARALHTSAGPGLAALFRQQYGEPTAKPPGALFFPIGEKKTVLELSLSEEMEEALSFLTLAWEAPRADDALAASLSMLYRETLEQWNEHDSLQLQAWPDPLWLDVRRPESTLEHENAFTSLVSFKKRYSVPISVKAALANLREFWAVDDTFVVTAALLRSVYLGISEPYHAAFNLPLYFRIEDPDFRYSARKRSAEEVKKLQALKEKWDLRSTAVALDTALAMLYWDETVHFRRTGYELEAVHALLEPVCHERGTLTMDTYAAYYSRHNGERDISERSRLSPSLEKGRAALLRSFKDPLLMESLAIDRAYQLIIGD